MAIVPVDLSDLQKIHDTLANVETHMARRDESNAALHLATNVRYAPLTSEVSAQRERVGNLIKEQPNG